MDKSLFLTKILAQKEKEVAQMPLETLKPLRQTYSFYEYVKHNQNHMQVIAELKKASPSFGAINMEVDLLGRAKQYEQAGAAMISVLTDASFFKGDIAYLKEVSQNVSIPTLNKDFIIDEKQIIRARNAGATVILLIVAALPKARLKELYDYATQLGLEVLVETHNERELEIAHHLSAKLIGVNNRDLHTFETHLETSIELAEHFRSDVVYISESAIKEKSDVERLAFAYQGILCGTSLMLADDVTAKIKELKIDKG